MDGNERLKEDETDALPSRLRYTNLDVLCTLISILTYFFDLIMDIVVAIYFYTIGSSTLDSSYLWYSALTILFILLPSLTMTGFSFRWYLNDAHEIHVPIWKWTLRLIILFLQLSVVLRYFDSLTYGLLSRASERLETSSKSSKGKKGEGEEAQGEALSKRRKYYYTLMIYEDADATLLRLFECFLESAPQLVLQIYILIHREKGTSHETSNSNSEFLRHSILVLSVTSSLVSLAWSLVIYHRSLRYSYPNKKNMSLKGSAFQFLWHFLSISARVLALSLFASVCPNMILLIVGAHVVIMSSWILFQKTEACSTPFEEFLFSIVLGAIYIFSFFNAKDEPTRWKYVFYYSFCFVENSLLLLFWFLYSDNSDGEYGQKSSHSLLLLLAITTHYLSFFAGILFMTLYYMFFHPTGVNSSLMRKLNLGSKQSHQENDKRTTRVADPYFSSHTKALSSISDPSHLHSLPISHTKNNTL